MENVYMYIYVVIVFIALAITSHQTTHLSKGLFMHELMFISKALAIYSLSLSPHSHHNISKILLQNSTQKGKRVLLS